jgi:chromosome segregation and condensation protein ScpB
VFDPDTDDELLPTASDDGLSLEDLGRTYAQLIGTGNANSNVYSAEHTELVAQSGGFPRSRTRGSDGQEHAGSAEAVADLTSAELERLVAEGEAKLLERHTGNSRHRAGSHSHPDASSGLPVTPQRVVEAVLFVGDPEGSGIAPSTIAALMRGVSVQEVHAYVDQLNSEYTANGHCFRIELHGNNYRLVLAADATSSLERLKGRLRETRLSGLAIDCLAVVAYRPGITGAEIDKMLNQPCGTQLSQLVRRQLLVFQPAAAPRGGGRYLPADRLLQVLGLTDWSELPVLEED